MDSLGPTPQATPRFDQSTLPMLLEGYVYKLTSVSELVVRRHVKLFKEKFTSYHNYEVDKGKNRKSWYLDCKCKLSPSSFEDIGPAERRVIRPQGTWTITATVTRPKQAVNLYMFTISWPASWAAKGYTSFTFGFESLEDAKTWHSQLQASIANLKEATLSRRGKSLAAGCESNGGVSNTATPTKRTIIDGERLITASMVSDAFRSVDSSCPPAPEVPSRIYTNVLAEESDSKQGAIEDTMSVLTMPEEACTYFEAEECMGDRDSGTGVNMGHADGSESDDDYGDTDAARIARRRARLTMNERWVPYKQTNGVSVYYHNQMDDPSGVGGEYMVSAVVRGSPMDVLDVLMYGSANTTILGPARKVEILQCTKPDATTTKELMRITIEAPGLTGKLCAPRVFPVERILKTDETGMYCVLFATADEVVSGCETCRQLRAAVGLPPGEQNNDTQTQTVQMQEATAPATPYGRGLWSRWPVNGWVRGGYTIAPLANHKLETSPESLLTAIIKVDLGGACGEKSWFRPLADLVGVREAFLDRILMTVILVRDEVEQGRFAVQPFQLVGAQGLANSQLAGSNDSGAVAGSRFYAQSKVAAQQNQRQSQNLAAGNSVDNIGARADALAAAASMLSSDMLQPAQATSGQLETASTSSLEMQRGEAILDTARMRELSTLDPKVWSAIHAPGTDAPFVVRGPTYLKDKKKIPAGQTQFVFAAMDVIQVPHVVDHVARFLPSIRDSGVPFAFIINLIIPGTPLLGIVATFATEHHPATLLQHPPRHPMEEGHDWQPFDFVLHKFLTSTPEVRNKMLKLIPHIADGSWMIKQSVGTTPVILGKALKTTYHMTPQYIEVDIDISANSVASYVTGLVRGATKSLVIDMGFVLEGTAPWELPEALLGTLRLNHLDVKTAKMIDITKEIPLRPPTYRPREVPTPVQDELEGMADGVTEEGDPIHGYADPTIFKPSANSSPQNLPADVGIGAVLAGPAFASMSGGVSSRSIAAALSSQSSLSKSAGGFASMTAQSQGSTTTFGMRHRAGHSRATSNADSCGANVQHASASQPGSALAVPPTAGRSASPAPAAHARVAPLPPRATPPTTPMKFVGSGRT